MVIGGAVEAARAAARSAAATDARPTTAIGSSGCGTTASARDQVASQRVLGRPMSTRIGGQR